MRRFEALPEGAQRLVLVAAADPTGDVALLRRAARVLGIANNNATDAAAEALVEIGARVQFRHPLVRSAIYSGASLEDHQAVHLALAAATDAQTDPDRRAWHRALAAAEADEEVASELERSAARRRLAGGLAAAAAFLQRSVTLTEDPAHRADRALAAAQAHIYGGAFSEALSVLSVAESDAQHELQRARDRSFTRADGSGRGPITEASRRLFKAARRLEPLDASLARETYLDALATAMFAGPFGPAASCATSLRRH